MKRFGLHAGLWLAVALILLPPLWVLRTSLVPESMAYSTDIFPAFSLENYQGLFGQKHFGSFYLNSIIVSLGSVLLALPFAAAMGYAFARFQTGGRFGRFLVYAAHNIPFLAWILMGFFEGIPVDLEWAAMTDGTTAWGAFWRIVLPVSLPGLAAAGVLGFILSWNEFLFALVLTGSKTATIPVALASLQTSNGIQIGKVSAGVVLAILPLIVASRFIQRFIVQGLTFGSVK